jgi:hypothetical protein
MIVRIALNALAAGFVLTGKVLVAVRLRRQPTGWRDAAGVVLRGEPSKFALSAFGLTVPGASGVPDFEAHVTRQLAVFLQTEPEARYRLRHAQWITTRFAIEHVDLVVQHFNEGSLERIEPILSPGNPDATDTADREKAHAAIVTAYNRTRQLPEAQRPIALLAELRGIAIGDAMPYTERLLGACCVSSEPLPAGDGRFAPPEFRTRRCLGDGFLAFVVRTDPAQGMADVWARVHHIGSDGAPLQELVSRLERAWGSTPIAFPEPGTVTLGPRPCFLVGEREVYESLSFHDFAPLLALRKRLNARLANEVGGDITLACLLLWRLAREPEFAKTRFASTVDVPAGGACERDVDLVSLRPADYGSGEAGLVQYARVFNRIVVECRGRVSPVRRAAQTAALLPAWLHRKLLDHSPVSVRDTFGDVCLSLVRDAKIVVGILADIGFSGGFIAIGSVGLPTVSGRAVGSVSVKGDRAATEAYPVVIRRVLERCKES